MPIRYHPNNDDYRREDMPAYHSNNIYNIFNDEVRSIPDAIGSKNDTREGEVTQLHDNVDTIDIVPIETINDTIQDQFTKGEIYKTSVEKQLFAFTVPIDVDSVQGLPIVAQSLVIDNFTNRWIFIPSLRRYVPPDFYGVVMTANALRQVSVMFQSPGGIVQPAPTAGTYVFIVAHFERLIDNPGTSRL